MNLKINLKWILLILMSLSNLAIAKEMPKPSEISLQGADHYSLKVGDTEVIALSDGTVPQDLHALLRDTTAEKTDRLLKNELMANPVEASINAYYFKLGSKSVLVDTGAGDFFGPGYGGKLLSSLQSIGVKPEDITDILITHAHDDHIGGLVHQGKPVFSNATVHLSKLDFDFFMDRTNSEKKHYAMSYFDQAATALKPCSDAGKIKTFTDQTEVLPGIMASIHAGHTPGSTFYQLKRNGQSLTFIGDIIHVAEVQGPSPSITIAYDVSTADAAKTRIKSFQTFAADETLVAVPHLHFPGLGHLQKSGSGFRWIPVPYSNRDTTPAQVYADPHKNGDQ